MKTKLESRSLALCSLIPLVLILATPALGQRRDLWAPMTHLRSGDEREWDDFPKEPQGAELVVDFQAKTNPRAATLGLRRIDIKHGWRAKLNGKMLGRLASDENDMIQVWELPPGALKHGANRLRIEPTGENPDDIKIGQVWLDPRPRKDVLGAAHIVVAVTDENGKQLPCRINLVDKNGSLPALGAESNNRLAVRQGTVYSVDGRAKIGVPPGEYRVFAGRGFEYSLDSKPVSVAAGETSEVRLSIRRVVDTTGMVACDTHVHTFTISRHGDATLEERMITIAGEGVELPIATDHNAHVDYESFARRLGVRRYFTPVIGNEVTTRVGHFNVFPVRAGAAPPDHRSSDWKVVFKNIFATPDVKVAILNHPRDVHAGYRPFDPKHHLSLVGENLDGWELRANAMEMINSAAMQSHPMTLVRDWFGFLNRGRRITPIGSSDSHEVLRKIVGQGRTYIQCDDGDVAKINVHSAVQHLLEGRVSVSLGLLTEITVDGKYRPGDLAPRSKQPFKVKVRVQGPEWTTVERVELYVNGRLFGGKLVPAEQKKKAGVKWEGEWTIPRPHHDVHVVAIARGPGVFKQAPSWRIAKSYQPTSTNWRPYVMSITGAVLLDADGDGRWSSAYDYAKQLDQSADGELKKLLELLAPFDPIVASHAAHRWRASGGLLLAEETRQEIAQSGRNPREGFQAYIEAWRVSQRARARRN